MAEGKCSSCGEIQVIGGNCPNCGMKIEVRPCLKSMIHRNASIGMIHAVSSKKQSTNKNGIFSRDMMKKRIVNGVS